MGPLSVFEVVALHLLPSLADGSAIIDVGSVEQNCPAVQGYSTYSHTISLHEITATKATHGAQRISLVKCPDGDGHSSYTAGGRSFDI
jgi:prephenate dehydrogenase